MSLIVQVNGGGGPAANSQPPQNAAHHLPAGAAHREQGATTIITQIPPPQNIQVQPSPAQSQAVQAPLTVLSRVANQQLTGLTRITTAGGGQHVVQHHPPPLRMVHLPNGNQLPVSAAAAFSAFSANSVVSTVALPTSPAPVAIRHVLPQTPVTRPPQLPRSPVRQNQLTQSPILRHQITTGNAATPMTQQRLVAAHPAGQIRTFHPMKVGGAGTIMVTQRQQPTLAMLPQAPSPGGILTALPSQGLLQTAGSNLLTFPLKIQAPVSHQLQTHVSQLPPPQQIPQHLAPPPLNMTMSTVSSTPAFSSTHAILPPNTYQQILFPANSHNDSDDIDVPEEASPTFRGRGVGLLSPRGHKDRRNLPCPLALQDHTYYIKPQLSPTPPPASQSPQPLLREALEEHQRRQQMQQHHNHPFKSFGFDESLSQPVGFAEIVSDPPGSNTTAGEPIGTSALPSRVQANLNSIEEAGVGPMAPLVADDAGDDGEGSRLSMSSAGEDEHAGEETETAPEAEGDDDSVTRCICDFLHDDGYMICCDKCLVWQHVVCMGLDKNNIPDVYLCEVCKPRPIDRKRARLLQARRRGELFANASSSDEDRRHSGGGVRRPRTDVPGFNNLKKRPSILHNNKKMVDRKADLKASGKKPKQFLKKNSTSLLDKSGLGGATTAVKTLSPSAVDGSPATPATNGKMKKTYRKRKPSEKPGNVDNVRRSSLLTTSVCKKSASVARRKSSQVTSDTDGDNDDDDEDEVVGGGSGVSGPAHDLDDVDRSAQHLRSWIDQYEEAVTNHYSPELRARLSGNKFVGLANELRASVIGGPTRCNVSLKGNGVKILTASTNLTSNTPIIECKGKLMLASQLRGVPSKAKGNSPYVFFYQLGDQLEIALDEKTYGNDSRFCRRSANNYNAELRHVVDKGSLHLFIVAVRSLDKNQEILLPLETSDMSAPLPSISSEVREMKKPLNGLIGNSTDDEPLAARTDVRDRKKKERKKSKRASQHSEDAPGTGSAAPRKTRGNQQAKVTTPVKTEIKAEPSEVDVKSSPIKNEPAITTESPVKAEEESGGSDGEKPTVNGGDLHSGKMMSPMKGGFKGKDNSTNPHATMLGLPDNKGLIVGVNTINYDASSSVRNKAKTREEKKMEMIMKAFEAMEKAQQRRKESDGGRDEKTPAAGGSVSKRRRRSSSTHKMTAAGDSNLDVSSADESKPEPKRNKRKGRKSGPTTPQRRRSRIMSGGTASAMSTDEDHATSSGLGPSGQDLSSMPGSASLGGGFRFPKTKKSMVTDWMHDANETGHANSVDDDVSANYLRGSRSPPGIATHLLRASAPLSPVKSVCSAKKRWLRQAISEDHTEEAPVNGNASPSDAGFGDYVTPLKKRRLASYKDDQQDHDIRSTNGLKGKLLSNFVLEAVLDHALEDMAGAAAGGRSVSVDSMMSPNADSCMSAGDVASSPIKGHLRHHSADDTCSSREAYPDDSLDAMGSKADAGAAYDDEDYAAQGVADEGAAGSGDADDVDVEEEDEEEEEEEPSRDDDEEEEDDDEVTQPEDSKVPDEETLDEHPTEKDTAASSVIDTYADEEAANFEQPMDQKRSTTDEFVEPSSQTDSSLEPISSDVEYSPRKSEPEVSMKKSVTPIKTPEPSLVFKSFFTSNVSIEELEAEIEASQKARLVDEQKSPSLTPTPTASSLPPTDLSTSAPTPQSTNTTSDVSSMGQSAESFELTKQIETFRQYSIEESGSSESSKPKEKKRFSLADYKKRRQTEGVPLRPSMETSSSSVGSSRSTEDREGPGTPTMDEELASLAVPPTLNTLPLFEKLGELEKEQRQMKKNAHHSGLDGAPMSPPEPKREDLTERLKKEFGLTMEEEEEENRTTSQSHSTGDDHKDRVSPPPLPPPPPPPSMQPASRFTPNQYPSYPASYPVPPFPSSTKFPAAPTPTTAAPPPPHPFTGRGSSGGSNSGVGGDSLSFPPPLPPPPPAPVLANAPHPPPSASLLNRSESDPGYSRTNGTSSRDIRRPSSSSSSSSSNKDYYSSSHSSSSMRGSGYYSSSSRRDRDHRDRDYHQRSSSSSSSSSSRRGSSFHSSRTYY